MVLLNYYRVMQDDSSVKVHKSLSMQLSRIAAEKTAKSIDSLKQIRRSVASQVLGPKSRFAQSNNPLQTSSPKPYEFGFSVLNELKKINILKNPMSRPTSISEYHENRNTRRSPAEAKSTVNPNSPNKTPGSFEKRR